MAEKSFEQLFGDHKHNNNRALVLFSEDKKHNRAVVFSSVVFGLCPEALPYFLKCGVDDVAITELMSDCNAKEIENDTRTSVQRFSCLAETFEQEIKQFDPKIKLPFAFVHRLVLRLSKSSLNPYLLNK